MIDAIIFNKRIEEVASKYERENIGNIKIHILNNIKKESRESITASLTNPLEEKASLCVYNIDGKEIEIPTIIYDGEPFTFLVDSTLDGKYKPKDTDKERIGHYRIITENNRSVLYGDTCIKRGYINMNPEDIIQVNSYDNLSDNLINNKYLVGRKLKYPEWISIDELNKRTLMKRSYNDILIKGIHDSDFTISYDEPNESTIRYAYESNSPLVKVLRRKYPNAIENCDDPYSYLK